MSIGSGRRTEELTKASHKLAEEVYKQTSGRQAGAGPQPGGPEQAGAGPAARRGGGNGGAEGR